MTTANLFSLTINSDNSWMLEWSVTHVHSHLRVCIGEIHYLFINEISVRLYTNGHVIKLITTWSHTNAQTIEAQTRLIPLLLPPYLQ